MEGRSVAIIDNIARQLKSETLCVVLTGERLSGRLLGANKMIDVPCKATIFATGNNLVLSDDLSARAVLCALDPECERPEERHFDVNLVDEVLNRRAELVFALLTIVRAYLAAGEPKPKVPPFGRFEDWSRFVRYPLIWRGMADPCDTRQQLEDRDPVTAQLAALAQAWHDVLGSKPTRVKDAIEEARREPKPGESKGSIEARAALYDAFEEVGGHHSGKLSPIAIGQFISKIEKRIEGGLRFEKARTAQRSVLWRVRVMEDQARPRARVRSVRMVRLPLTRRGTTGASS